MAKKDKNLKKPKRLEQLKNRKSAAKAELKDKNWPKIR